MYSGKHQKLPLLVNLMINIHIVHNMTIIQMNNEPMCYNGKPWQSPSKYMPVCNNFSSRTQTKWAIKHQKLLFCFLFWCLCDQLFLVTNETYNNNKNKTKNTHLSRACPDPANIFIAIDLKRCWIVMCGWWWWWLWWWWKTNMKHMQNIRIKWIKR